MWNSLQKRDTYMCYDDFDQFYYSQSPCNGNWNRWGRWLVTGLIVADMILVPFLCICMARRRRNRGLPLYHGTGWMAPPQHHHGGMPPPPPPPGANGYGNANAASPYYGGGGGGANHSYYAPPAGPPEHQQTGIELTQPPPAYAPPQNYAPPSGPPPTKV